MTANLIRPILRGRDIKRNSYTWAGYYIILTYFDSHKFLKEKCPSIFKYLSRFEKQLKNRGQCRYLSNGKTRKPSDADYPGYPGMHHWLELDNCPSSKYLDDLNKPKILYSEIVRSPQFYFDQKGDFIPEASAFYLSGQNNEQLCDYLNSYFAAWVFKTFYAGGGLGNDGYRYKKSFLLNLRIPKNLSNDYLKDFKFDQTEIDYINEHILEFQNN